jgi:hypothetical protein
MIGYLRHHRVLAGLVFAVWAFFGVGGDIEATYEPGYQFVCQPMPGSRCIQPIIDIPAEFDVTLFVYRLLWMVVLAVLLTGATLAVVELIRRVVRPARAETSI